MPVDLAELLAPGHTAVLTMEMQRGVIGDLSPLPVLAEEAAATGIVERTAALLEAARTHGVCVMHCTAVHDPASPANAPVLAAMRQHSSFLAPGSAAAELVPGLEADGDLISSRARGVSPFGETSLAATLRDLGVATVVATGVSVNVGIVGLAIEAVNFGFRVAVATDAMCGVPHAYAETVLEHTLAHVATRVQVADIIGIWERHRREPNPLDPR